LKIAYLFKSGRLQRESKETYPNDFFYGADYLKSKHIDVSILDITKLGISGRMGLVLTLITLPIYKITGLHFAVALRILKIYKKEKFNDYDVLIATTTSLGVALSLLKKIGFIKSEIIFIVMGLGDLMQNRVRNAFLQWFLSKVFVLSISKGEMNYVEQLANNNLKIEYLPFGVDVGFWCRGNGKTSEYVLSIGNDLNRDYELLISSWQVSFPELIIITRLEVKTDLDNVKIIKGDWNEQYLSDEKIRTYIQNANFIVIPVQQTSQPSGQSFCLQAMACEKAIIMSDINGLWEPELIKDKKNCLLYQPENKQSLIRKVEVLLTDAELKGELAINARKTVENNFCSSNTGASIKKYLDKRICA
jgi:glycosyltransferase involved in cell wall biosynthesis